MGYSLNRQPWQANTTSLNRTQEDQIKPLFRKVRVLSDGGRHHTPAPVAVVLAHTYVLITWNTFRQLCAQHLVHPAPVTRAPILSWKSTKNIITPSATLALFFPSPLRGIASASLGFEQAVISGQLENNHPQRTPQPSILARTEERKRAVAPKQRKMVGGMIEKVQVGIEKKRKRRRGRGRTGHDNNSF